MNCLPNELTLFAHTLYYAGQFEKTGKVDQLCTRIRVAVVFATIGADAVTVLNKLSRLYVRSFFSLTFLCVEAVDVYFFTF